MYIFTLYLLYIYVNYDKILRIFISDILQLELMHVNENKDLKTIKFLQNIIIPDVHVNNSYSKYIYTYNIYNTYIDNILDIG